MGRGWGQSHVLVWGKLCLWAGEQKFIIIIYINILRFKIYLSSLQNDSLHDQLLINYRIVQAASYLVSNTMYYINILCACFLWDMRLQETTYMRNKTYTYILHILINTNNLYLHYFAVLCEKKKYFPFITISWQETKHSFMLQYSTVLI